MTLSLGNVYKDRVPSRKMKSELFGEFEIGEVWIDSSVWVKVIVKN